MQAAIDSKSPNTLKAFAREMTMSHLAVHCNSACMQIDRKTTFVYNAISNQPSKLVMVILNLCQVMGCKVNAELKG